MTSATAAKASLPPESELISAPSNSPIMSAQADLEAILSQLNTTPTSGSDPPGFGSARLETGRSVSGSASGHGVNGTSGQHSISRPSSGSEPSHQDSKKSRRYVGPVFPPGEYSCHLTGRSSLGNVYHRRSIPRTAIRAPDHTWQ